ncbi:MAG: bifunctional 4-hydroxy-3-methylbut-2-enyl diphosphate reductase/30S ribosomal protein S1, partial [Defluviitaleaceae bacterium]|nr:bifunctional 4-hydroxy-3-methylbut-2-enyl diphosphate reductase/30S ribosomal protein S1 [Defluviitaleaceae bacterium]
FPTICPDVKNKQKSAAKLAENMDYMLIIGDKNSSNTKKLLKICRKIQKNSYLIESIEEIELNIFSQDDKIGITAGASTPPALIKEVSDKFQQLIKNP